MVPHLVGLAVEKFGSCGAAGALAGLRQSWLKIFSKSSKMSYMVRFG